ncbi:hypothetical protein [uncultured Corynebacterium sp.]|uniref:hypothetical protein n=1 Tax=uncultured Corynebacterium sp. TaxID=159447 RepID=UPI0025DD3EFA|nr:hypothetical protein [uncultured Corynebacterium sp.]
MSHASSGAAAVDPDTTDVSLHVKPGRTRAPFFRYIRINLPRLTRAAIIAVMALMAVTAGIVATSGHLPFAAGDVALWLVVALAAIFVVVALIPSTRPWDFGVVPACAALLAYVGGLFGDAPYVWNGASIELAAAWNSMMLLAVAYLLLRWAESYGVIAVYPDDQGFES